MIHILIFYKNLEHSGKCMFGRWLYIPCQKNIFLENKKSKSWCSLFHYFTRHWWKRYRYNLISKLWWLWKTVFIMDIGQFNDFIKVKFNKKFLTFSLRRWMCQLSKTKEKTLFIRLFSCSVYLEYTFEIGEFLMFETV